MPCEYSHCADGVIDVNLAENWVSDLFRVLSRW